MTTPHVFPCARCQAPVPVSPEAMRDARAEVVCPSCGQRYTRRPSGAPRPPAAPQVPASAPAAGPAPGPAAESPPPGPVTTPTAAPPAYGAGTSSPSGPTRPLGEGGRVEAPAFEDGLLVAGRWRVVRFLARGGMGDVYEVEDTELRERVALKTIHPAIAAEEGAVERFKRETHLARRVTHPNVCRIFDVGFHELAPGEPPVVFLTMELLVGETLGARLKRTGRMSAEVALALARQLGGALAAAHAAGVVHRDFKSENVFLVPGRDGERAVVTDFGIARGGAEDSFGRTLTALGGAVGTPAYMAPEQVVGDSVGPASDQYAFAVVLFEMVTGELPFKGESPLTVAARRLTEPPPSPRTAAPELDPRWERALARALERAPEARFPDVLDLVAALEPGAPLLPAPVPAARPPRRDAKSRRERLLAALLLVALAGASVWAWRRVEAMREARGLSARPVAARTAVAVLAPRNLSGRSESAWLSTALGEMLATELAAARDLRVVPGEEVARAAIELGVAPTESLERGLRARLREALGADFLVLGGYTSLAGGGPIRIDLRLEDAASGEAVESVAESGAEAELFEVVARIGERLRASLGVAGAASAEAARLPASPEAARAYAEGLDALRRFEPERAREALDRAVGLDPGNALARSALASAWSALGHRERAEEAARQAFELSAGLPENERRIVEARYLETARQWRRAAELWQSLWAAWPDTLDYGLRVAACRTQAGEAREALEATTRMRALAAPEGEDPRIDLAEAAAAGATGDYRRQADAAQRAAERAAATGARRLEAEARVAESWALRNLGRAEPARAAGERAAALYAEIGDRAGEAAAITATASVLLDAGDLDGARAAYESALDTYRQVGDHSGVARSLNNLAVVLRNRGDLDGARERYEQLEEIARETGDRVGAAHGASNGAAVLADLGDLDGALARLEAALASWRELGDQAGEASALASLGNVRRRRGELAAAETALAESLAERRKIGQRVGEVLSLNGLGAVALDRGDLAGAARRFDEAAALARELETPSGLAGALQGQGDLAALAGDPATARARYGEALAARQRTGERAAAARTRLALARLAAEREPETAVAEAAQVLGDPASARQPELEAQARLVVARAELARGRAAAAAAALAPARDLSRAVGVATALELELAAARVEAASGRAEAAVAALAQIARRAAERGLLGVELEARLTGAALAGDRAAVAAAAARARGAGFLALAGRAVAAGPAPAASAR